ncbi:SDR family oxidoreductase [Xanthovirga aplysinae]|uniref:SDR family oxidoreductase n=1 Tax=Xanthovirga aplysinae TaxID=2529853 RepID=UPI0012BBA480|nr:SDR family oxidoreductase [Xanthovirga aplysinae]MTI30738.1 SDR family NAD(P)-dependent oxidoreductase [Xanthovirga aplysinae]
MSKIKLNPEGKTVLISGANRGIGRAIAIEFLAQGAKKVYAGARDPLKLSDLKEKFGERIIPIKLDVTDNETIENLRLQAQDVDILVNNAGILAPGGFLSANTIENLKHHFSVNVWGLLKLTNALIDSLKNKEEAAIVNLISMVGLANMPMIGAYSASKATVHSITQGIRGELEQDNILVSGVYPGPIDTEMAKGFEMEKESPGQVAKKIIQALKDGQEDIFPDKMSEKVGKDYFENPKMVEKEFGAFNE